MNDKVARNPEHTVMDVLDRVLGELGNIDRITIITVVDGGDSSKLFSNGRSEAEMHGMLHMALHKSVSIATDEDDVEDDD